MREAGLMFSLLAGLGVAFAASPTMRFPDVPESDPDHAAMVRCVETGFMLAWQDGFHPEAVVDRLEWAKIVARLADLHLEPTAVSRPLPPDMGPDEASRAIVKAAAPYLALENGEPLRGTDPLSMPDLESGLARITTAGGTPAGDLPRHPGATGPASRRTVARAVARFLALRDRMASDLIPRLAAAERETILMSDALASLASDVAAASDGESQRARAGRLEALDARVQACRRALESARFTGTLRDSRTHRVVSGRDRANLESLIATLEKSIAEIRSRLGK